MIPQPISDSSNSLNLQHDIDAAAVSGAVFTGAAVSYYAVPYLTGIEELTPGLFLLMMISLSTFTMSVLNAVFDRRVEVSIHLAQYSWKAISAHVFIAASAIALLQTQTNIVSSYAFGASMSLIAIYGVFVGAGSWWVDSAFN